MFWEKADLRARQVLRVVCVLLSIAVAVLMVAEISARHLFTHAFRGLPEIYLLLAMWLYMLGAGLASANNSHLRIGILNYLIKTPRASYLHRLVISGLTLIISVFFVWWALGLILWAFERPQTTPILRMPWLTSQASIMVAGLLVAAYAVRDFIKAVRDRSQVEPTVPAGEEG